MAKDWDKAKALYGMGKTLRDIEQESGIPRNTIDRRAKAESWSKTETGQEILEIAKAKAILGQSSGTKRDILNKESDKLLKAQGLHLDAGIMLAELVIEVAKEERTTKGILAATQSLMNTAKLTGAQSFYPPKEQSKEAPPPVKILSINDLYE